MKDDDQTRIIEPTVIIGPKVTVLNEPKQTFPDMKEWNRRHVWQTALWVGVHPGSRTDCEEE